MHAVKTVVLLRLPTVLGIDLSITNEVVLIWLAALLTFVIVMLACRRRGLVARGGFQNFFEAVIEFMETEVIRGSIGEKGVLWAPFLLTLFFFILFGNLLGMVPDPHRFKAATANISVTAALAMLVFVTVVAVNIRMHGLIGFLKKFYPSGLPKGVGIVVAPIEVLSWLAKPVSLAIRLFANMLAGHQLLLIFIGLEMSALWVFKALPLVGAVAMGAFEIFVCFIQAFIFTMLAGIYIREAMDSH